MDNSQFCHLHVHDQYSVLDGFGKAEDYAKKAKELGFTHLALTNHGNVDGIIKFQNACKAEEIIPILGCEFYVAEDIEKKEKGEARYHVVALIKNETGLKNVFQMLSVANLTGFYYRPRISLDLLLKHCEGLVIMTACASSVLRMDRGVDTLLEIEERYPGSVYLEIMPHQMKEQVTLNKNIYKLSKETGLPAIASIDCHYPDEEGELAQEVLLAIQTKKKWKDENRWKFSIGGLYLRSADEMAQLFKEQGALPPSFYLKAIKNTMEVARKCEGFEIEQHPVELPKVPGYEDRDETNFLEELCHIGYEKRIQPFLSELEHSEEEYLERLDEEFGLICELGFQRYFLIVWELIDWCKKQEIMTGPGRGSVGGCLIAYLLFITDVDPLRHGLLFSRFISPARIDLPDIDMDFEDIKRGEIRRHLEEMYGEFNVVGLSTFLKMKGRSALRDVSRVFDVPNVDVDKAAKSIVVRSGGDFRSDFTIEDTFQTFEDGIAFAKKYPEVAKLSMKLEGQVRGAGQHAAAMCISKEDLREGLRCNFVERNKILVANWDKYDAEYMGLMKLDVLGLSALTVLSATKKMVKENHGEDIDWDSIPLDDPNVYDEIAEGNNVGAFQIGSLGLMKLCRELEVDDFETLVHATALYRPGTLRSGMTNLFVRRKRGEEPVEYIHPALEALTKETYGIILYQEQVMKFMFDLGGLGWKTCDTVRKVISKSQGDALFQKFKGIFADGCVERGTLDRTTAEDVWDELSSFGSYGFNKSHSVEYSLITYWDMWCKTYYPAEFMCATLTYGSGDKDKKEAYIEEVKRLGLEIVLPKIGVSHPTEWRTRGENKIYTPIMEIKGVGEKVAIQVSNLGEEKGEGGFFRKNKKVKKPNKKIMGILEKIKFFSKGESLSDDELEECSQFFTFSLSRDPMRRFRGFYDHLKEKEQIDFIGDINWRAVDKTPKLFFGNMTEIKFGYRHNVEKAQKKGIGDVAGTIETLGGVYGNLKDETDYSMMVFNSEIYKKKKIEIEHCAGDWILAKASHPHRNTNIVCSDAWLGSEILKGELEGSGLALEREVCFRDRKLLQCSECLLRNECKAPVMPSLGQYNIMMVGEAPGRDEDLQRKGFVGKTGQEVLWPALEARGIYRDMLHITNTVKCWPSETKTPTKRLIKTCGNLWLRKEIEMIRPIAILAFGNTNLKFFKEQDGGIMNMAGEVEWNYEFNCWVCWSIHPSAVIYHRENIEKLEEGIDSFAKLLENVTQIF